MTLVGKTPLRISSRRIEGLIKMIRRRNDGDSLTRRKSDKQGEETDSCKPRHKMARGCMPGVD